MTNYKERLIDSYKRNGELNELLLISNYKHLALKMEIERLKTVINTKAVDSETETENKPKVKCEVKETVDLAYHYRLLDELARVKEYNELLIHDLWKTSILVSKNGKI
jgi:hypothetical protein